jgi:putative membrane protein
MLVRLIINGVALLAAALLVPQIQVEWGTDEVQAAITLGVLALIFALLNSYLRPILKLLSLPINLITLGLFSLVINAAMLVILAWVVDLVWQPVLTIGGFPPTFSSDTLVGALLGALVVSVVSTTLSLLTPNA